MLQYRNLMTGGVGLYCDVLVAVGFTRCQVTHDCRQVEGIVRGIFLAEMPLVPGVEHGILRGTS